MSGRTLHWLGLGLVTTAGAGVMALTAMMNSAFAHGDVPPDPPTRPSGGRLSAAHSGPDLTPAEGLLNADSLLRAREIIAGDLGGAWDVGNLLNPSSSEIRQQQRGTERNAAAEPPRGIRRGVTVGSRRMARCPPLRKRRGLWSMRS
jgi:hypothetical protein